MMIWKEGSGSDDKGYQHLSVLSRTPTFIHSKFILQAGLGVTSF